MSKPKCPICGEPVATRYAKYCRKHKGGAAMPKYGKCLATSHLVKSALLSPEESQFFSELETAFKLSEKTEGEQLLYVHMFFAAICVRREAEKLFRGKGDVSMLNRWIATHAMLSDKLGLTTKTKPTSYDPYAVDEFLKRENGKAQDIS